MFVELSSLPSTSKVWVYQSNRKITSKEKEHINTLLLEFTQQWLVHGTPLKASFDVRFDYFIILAADDTASGCSIDNSVRIVKELGLQTGIDFFDRNKVAFQKDGEIELISLKELKVKFTEGNWGHQTLFFNNAIATLQELITEWPTPAGKTWLKRYLNTTVITQ